MDSTTLILTHGSSLTFAPSNVTLANPFFLHPSDSPGTNLASHSFTSDNYTTWRSNMIMALSAKNKLGFVDGSIPKPAKDEKTYEAWDRVNNMVLSWLLNSIHPDPAASVLYVDSAGTVWKGLHDRFSPSNGPRIFVFECTIATSHQNKDFVAKYYNTLKGLWDKLATYVPIPPVLVVLIKILPPIIRIAN